MKATTKLGLKIMFWIARLLIEKDTPEEFKDELKSLYTSLSILKDE